MGVELLPDDIRESYEVAERHHACAILSSDFPSEWEDLLAGLTQLRLPRSQIVASGGGKSPIAIGLDGFFGIRAWKERSFDVRIVVDQETTLAPTHHVDYFKNRVAIEVEWNNKDPFYDRDLTTFRLLFDIDVLSVGVIITRASELQDVFNGLGKGGSYGASTTHMGKLVPKLNNRSGGGCPVLAFGMRKALYDAHR